MSETNKYTSYKIPDRNPFQENGSDFALSKNEIHTDISFDDEPFAEIEIDNNMHTSYEPAPILQPIEPVMDEKRKLFASMREIARYNPSPYLFHSKFYHKQAQYENSKVFYKQAVFMKDFEDDYAAKVPFSSYFPYYQLMRYDQLRTYFTWRTNIRNGTIENTSLSYAFVYIYELLNNIGVKNPIDGLDKLMSFWTAFKVFNPTVEKYLIKWIKDYHIYYELPKSFKEFLCENGLHDHYPDIVRYEPEMNWNFERLCIISKYNIKKSAFYTNETNQLISDCFDYVICKLKDILAEAGIELNHLIFQSSKPKSFWTPFSGALFYPALKQPDRRVTLSENEIYICNQNKWILSTVVSIESGRYLIGYIMKQMEAILRKITNYKYKLSANLNMIKDEISHMLDTAGISLEKTVTNAVLEFYRERNKTVVSVNEITLNRIRLEALDTQEKLIVPENDYKIATIFPMEEPLLAPVSEPPLSLIGELPLSPVGKPILPTDGETASPPVGEPALSDGWTSLKNVLNQVETNALLAILHGDKNIKQFADENGIMLEVLADGINEKAFDHIGDNILELDDNVIIYDEYKEKIMIMMG